MGLFPSHLQLFTRQNYGALSEPWCNWWNGFYALLACCFGASSGRKPCGKLDRWLDKKLVVQDISWMDFFFLFFFFQTFSPSTLNKWLGPAVIYEINLSCYQQGFGREIKSVGSDFSSIFLSFQSWGIKEMREAALKSIWNALTLYW